MPPRFSHYSRVFTATVTCRTQDVDPPLCRQKSPVTHMLQSGQSMNVVACDLLLSPRRVSLIAFVETIEHF